MDKKPQRIRKPLFSGFKKKIEVTPATTHGKSSGGGGRYGELDPTLHILRGKRLVEYYEKHPEKHPTTRARITMNHYLLGKKL